MTEKQALERLQQSVKAAGGQKAWAARHGVSPQFVCDVLHGRRGLTDTICQALGLIRETVYLENIRRSV
jgi:DNA-binding transcriptional regulator YdaS (Cro superfamily)